jgi:hypothetical protein
LLHCMIFLNFYCGIKCFLMSSSSHEIEWSAFSPWVMSPELYLLGASQHHDWAFPFILEIRQKLRMFV